MPVTKTQELLFKYCKRDPEHLNLLCQTLEPKNPDSCLIAYDAQEQEHIFKKLFDMARQPYDQFNTEDKIMPFLISGLETYRDGASMYSLNKGVNIDLEWKAIIFQDAAKLCRIIREAENHLLDGNIYKPPTPKSRPQPNRG